VTSSIVILLMGKRDAVCRRPTPYTGVLSRTMTPCVVVTAACQASGERMSLGIARVDAAGIMPRASRSTRLGDTKLPRKVAKRPLNF
jgi:hypothetical protein